MHPTHTEYDKHTNTGLGIEIMVERTKRDLGFDPSGILAANAARDHRTVFMKCTKCGEEFIRPVALLQKQHSCRPVSRFPLQPVFPLPRLECMLKHPDAKFPYRKRTTDAGHDIFSIEDVNVPRFGMANVHTGIHIACPEGWYYTIDSRSSLYIKSIMPYRAIIDATYTGELRVALMNSSEVDYQVKKGDRIAQIILHQVHDFDLAPVDEFSPEYNKRGEEGFGSTGR